MDGRLEGRLLAPGSASATALVLDEPLSFWGGFDPRTGRIVDARHPQRGASIRGRAIVMAAARGSSSSASVLAEAVRLGTAPAAIVLGEPDTILPIGATVADELYGRRLPIVVIPVDQLARMRDGDRVTVTADGAVLREARTPASSGSATGSRTRRS